MPGPLDGIRVLEFSQIVAAPFCGILLSDLGADVVKVEPVDGEGYRQSSAIVPNEGKRFQSLNRGKRALSIDLQHPQGRETILRLLPQFDVVLHNFRPGVDERLGLDYPSLSALHPQLIYASITGFGRRGPLAPNGATDLVAAAYSGLVAGDVSLDASGAPKQLTPAFSDYITGTAVAMGICAALYHRRDTGLGQRVDGSLLKSALAVQDVYVMREPVSDAILREPMLEQLEAMRAEGRPFAEQLDARMTFRWAGSGPPRLYYAGYICLDGALVLGCLTKPTRAGARRVLGLEGEDRSDDPDFDARDPSNAPLIASWKRRIEEQMRARPVADWIADFEAAGVPCAPAQIPEEMSEDAHVKAAGFMTDLMHDVTGPQQVVGPIIEMSATPTEARRAAPALGVHNDELLTELGLTPEEVAALRSAGVIR